MTYKFTVSDVIPATPREVFNAWLDSRAHGAMTGSKATMSMKIGGGFTASEGYIEGVNLELVPGKRIVQSWRTSEFAASDRDSKITVTLRPVAGGTKLTLLHTSVPDGQTGYKAGWREWYFEPMKTWFAKRGSGKRRK